MPSIRIDDIQPVEVYPFLPRPEVRSSLTVEQQIDALYDALIALTERVENLEKKVDNPSD